MNPFSLGLIATVLTTFPLGLFIWLYRPHNPIHRSFAVYSASIGFWASFSAVQTLSPDPATVSWAVRVMHWGSILIPVFFLQFLYFFTRKIPRSLLVMAYALALVFLVLNHTNLFVSGIVPKKPFHFFMKGGPVYPYYIAFFILSWTYGLVHLFCEMRRARDRKKRQLRLLFFGSLVGYLGGSGAFAPVYDFSLPILYPYGNFAIALYVLITAYAIVRHHLLDIEVIIKRTLVFAGLFGFVIGTVSLVVYFLNTYAARFVGVREPFSTALAIVIAMLLYEPVKTRLVKATDRYLFQKREDIKHILKRLSENIVKILDLNQVAKTILETFRESLRAETGAILLRNETGYRTLNSFGLGWTQANETYRPEDPLIQYVRSHPRLIHLDSEEASGKLPVLALGKLEAMKALVAIPLLFQNELIGLLTLGKKKSDQEYTAEEMDYFPIVAGQVAIALNNARLYQESIEARKKIEEMQLELIHREKMAFVADLVKGIAHEVFNPLLPVFYQIDDFEKEVFVELFQIFESEKERLSPEARKRFLKTLQDFRSGTQSLKTHTQHIHLVIDTLNKMQKEDKETIGPLDFKMFLKDSSALIGMELHGETREIPLEEDVPRGLPPVKGNPTLLAQVFVNLFKNAIDAMEGKPEKKIAIKADIDPGHPRFLKIDFSDTGSGIPADTLPRIFDFGFTTKGSEGQGIGLAQCKLIIEKFGGSLTCRSEPGRGTTFMIQLPLWQEEKGDKK